MYIRINGSNGSIKNLLSGGFVFNYLCVCCEINWTLGLNFTNIHIQNLPLCLYRAALTIGSFFLRSLLIVDICNSMLVHLCWMSLTNTFLTNEWYMGLRHKICMLMSTADYTFWRRHRALFAINVMKSECKCDICILRGLQHSVTCNTGVSINERV